MSHFYAGIQGQAGEATRMGSKHSGIDGYVQSHDARLSVSMQHAPNYGSPDEQRAVDHAHFTLGNGYSNHSGGRLAINFRDVTSVVNCLNQGDPKIDKIVQRIYAEIEKLNDEARPALKRIERRRKIEANKRQREFEEKQARLKALNETITDEERDNFCLLVHRIDPHDTDPIEQQNLRRWGLHEPERVNESILSGYGNIEPYRSEEGNLILYTGDGWNCKIFDLTNGTELDKDVVSTAGPA